MHAGPPGCEVLVRSAVTLYVPDFETVVHAEIEVVLDLESGSRPASEEAVGTYELPPPQPAAKRAAKQNAAARAVNLVMRRGLSIGRGGVDAKKCTRASVPEASLGPRARRRLAVPMDGLWEARQGLSPAKKPLAGLAVARRD